MAATPHTLDEGQLSFKFGNTVWQTVSQYDAGDRHLAICRRVQGIQAVDFVAYGGSASPLVALIEVKDFRPSGTTPGAINSKRVATEVAAKVAGTLLGISASGRQTPPDPELSKIVKRATDPSRRLEVVLHIECEEWGNPSEAKAELAVFTALLETALDWLPNCDVWACCEMVPRISDCIVKTKTI